jgi:hypothetical protein
MIFFTDVFLSMDNVETDQQARRASINAAFQRNKTYRDGTPQWARVPLRDTMMRRMAISSIPYRLAATVNDDEHRRILRGLSDSMTRDFRHLLHGGRLRYSTAAKAFDLYIKYLWRLGIVKSVPRHCPIDGIVLAAAKISGSWTRNDDESVHTEWGRLIELEAGAEGTAVWEHRVWLAAAQRLRSKAKKPNCDRQNIVLCHEGAAGYLQLTRFCR